MGTNLFTAPGRPGFTCELALPGAAAVRHDGLMFTWVLSTASGIEPRLDRPQPRVTRAVDRSDCRVVGFTVSEAIGIALQTHSRQFRSRPMLSLTLPLRVLQEEGNAGR
jgi:hypothetical protein